MNITYRQNGDYLINEDSASCNRVAEPIKVLNREGIFVSTVHDIIKCHIALLFGKLYQFFICRLTVFHPYSPHFT